MRSMRRELMQAVENNDLNRYEEDLPVYMDIAHDCLRLRVLTEEVIESQGSLMSDILEIRMNRRNAVRAEPENLDSLLRTNTVTEEDGHGCLICLCDYTIGEDKASVSCGHDFHKECVQTWLKNSNTCPCCRAALHDWP